MRLYAIPGDKDRIISIGTSGGGQMSSILGASGNMPEYYEYLYEAGALGVTKNADGSMPALTRTTSTRHCASAPSRTLRTPTWPMPGGGWIWPTLAAPITAV